MRDIEFVLYDGAWPALCHGKLTLSVDGEAHVLNGTLSSGGMVTHDADWNFEVEEGPWTVDFYDDFFTEEEQEFITQLVNENVSYGCCGGCI